MRSLGYRHLAALLQGETDLPAAVAAIKRDTRRYAKRQMTWFRKMAGIVWFSPDDGAALEEHVRNRLQYAW